MHGKRMEILIEIYEKWFGIIKRGSGKYKTYPADSYEGQIYPVQGEP